MDKYEQIMAQGLLAIPALLTPDVTAHWNDFCAVIDELGLTLAMSESRAQDLCRVWACSEYVARSCIRYPQLLPDLLSSGDLDRVYPADTLRANVQVAIASAENELHLGELLRYCRRREMVRIAWRDLAGYAELAETMIDVTTLADACIDESLTLLQSWHRQDFGTPIGAESGLEQGLVVLGMGKLGAHELNYSSDIDLIFAFPESGETAGASRSITNDQFFIGLGRRLIKLLDANTAHGFVYRVDMRLRPNGDSGPLVMNFDAMEAYYLLQGRDWERYAMIKARPVAGDIDSGRQLLDSLRPFIYRRYLDYGTFDALRDMKAMINMEVQRKGLQANIKLGPGGIREIEFIGQLFQLIRGGREPALRQRGIQPVLKALIDAGHLPKFVGSELMQDYIQLRRIENRLQAWADEQTHNLPGDGEKATAAWQRLALSLNPPQQYDFNVESMRKWINQIRARVQRHFEQVFAAPQAEDSSHSGQQSLGEQAGNVDWQSVWMGSDASDDIKLHFIDPDEALRRIAVLRDSHACRALSAQGRKRLDRLMPLLLGAIAESSVNPVGVEIADQTLHRVLQLVESVMRRTAYLALLVEHPMALSQLVKLCAASPWISEQLARFPLLLDELLDPRTLYAPLKREELAHQLARLLAEPAADDLEQQLEVLRYYKLTQVLRVAAADVVGAIPLMVVSDHLTWIAEVIVEQVLTIAIRHVVPEPEREKITAGFGVIAYGKMGGLELGYGSDLDLVFLHDGDQEASMRYIRLGQRIVHILTTRTPAGILYEVDMRLRPSGASGLLVSGVMAFADYQRNEAWTWEHQALLRARFVAGASVIAAQFQSIREEILARPRDAMLLRQEVKDMRTRMREELARGSQDQFDVKQGEGGIADIEFLVQYAVLRWGSENNDLLRWTDNIRQLEALSKGGYFSDQDSRLLIDAYQAYRKFTHRQALQQQAALVSADDFNEYRMAVSAIWSRFMDVDGTQ